MAINNFYTQFEQSVLKIDPKLKVTITATGRQNSFTTGAKVTINSSELSVSFTYDPLSNGCGASVFSGYSYYTRTPALRPQVIAIMNSFFDLAAIVDRQGIIVTTDGLDRAEMLKMCGFVPILEFGNPRHSERGTCLWVKFLTKEDAYTKFNTVDFHKVEIKPKMTLLQLYNSKEIAKATEPEKVTSK